MVCMGKLSVNLLLQIIDLGEHTDVMISLNMHATKLENFWQSNLMN
jgi:hypothetical protein